MSARLAGLVVLFLIVRLVLLVVRDPFFDELFTVWMASRPFGEILPALLEDSGPPLYYFLARLPNVFALRGLSLLFATAALIPVLRKSPLAALLLALYPPAALFAVDARAYALCALFVAVGTLAISEERPVRAALAMLLAAYTHWYGALFLPVVLFAKPRRRAVAAFVIACVLFVPGLLMASRQPVEAMGWMGERHAPQTYGFVGAYPEALFAPAPVALIVVSAIALIAGIVRDWRFAPMVLVPLLLALAFGLAGRNVYFPMRFEAVLAVPLMLWLAASLERWPARIRVALVAVLSACGAIAIVIGAIDHANRPLDAYRAAAQALPEDETVTATGYLYLEAVHQLGSERVRAYPPEQARHPGWRATRPPSEPVPPGLWIVERGAPELAAFRGRATVVFANDRAVILRASRSGVSSPRRAGGNFPP